MPANADLMECPIALKSPPPAPAQLAADFIRPDQPSKCTWVAGKEKSTSPHTQRPFGERARILPNILHAIGHTPMVKLNNIPKSYGITCDMYVKCEYLNPGGSVKDRIGFRMVEDAETRGLLKPGCTIIEPTSGNTGIGLAMACAVKGYKCIIVMPLKMSQEKVDALKVLGATIIRTPTAASFDSPEGLIAVSQRLQKEIPNSVVLDQYRNAGNPLAHYDGTGAEILWQCGGQVDMIVCGAGTGGTISGIGRKIKEDCPTCKVIAADPEGSVLARPVELNESDVNFYEVEGIGYDFIPTVLDHSVVDVWMKTNDTEALPLSRRLIAEEGLLCGGSSGTAMACAVKAAKELGPGQKCVVLLPDGIRNYMTKFVSDNWMEARDLRPSVNVAEHTWWNRPVSSVPFTKLVTVPLHVTCNDAFNVLKSEKVEQIVVVNNSKFEGVINSTQLINGFLAKTIATNSPVEKAFVPLFRRVNMTTSLGKVSRILEKDPFVVVVQEQTQYNGGSETGKLIETPVALVTKMDFLAYMLEQSACK